MSEPQYLFIAVETCFWREGTFTATVPGGTTSIKVNTRDFTKAPHSLGYCPVFDSIDKAKEDFPDARILRIGPIQLTKIDDGERLTFEAPFRPAANPSQ